MRLLMRHSHGTMKHKNLLYVSWAKNFILFSLGFIRRAECAYSQEKEEREMGAGLLFISCVINFLMFALRTKELEMAVHFLPWPFLACKHSSFTWNPRNLAVCRSPPAYKFSYWAHSGGSVFLKWLNYIHWQCSNIRRFYIKPWSYRFFWKLGWILAEAGWLLETMQLSPVS